jgi:hypothetical protein
MGQENTMEQDATQGAGNGDWLAADETAQGVDSAAAWLESLDRGSVPTSRHIRSSRWGSPRERVF